MVHVEVRKDVQGRLYESGYWEPAHMKYISIAAILKQDMRDMGRDSCFSLDN
jgi:hypothetical protein